MVFFMPMAIGGKPSVIDFMGGNKVNKKSYNSWVCEHRGIRAFSGPSWFLITTYYRVFFYVSPEVVVIVAVERAAVFVLGETGNAQQDRVLCTKG